MSPADLLYGWWAFADDLAGYRQQVCVCGVGVRQQVCGERGEGRRGIQAACVCGGVAHSGSELQ